MNIKVKVFSSKLYDEEFFNRFNDKKLILEYLPYRLNEQTVGLAEGAQAVCCFVNDVIDSTVIRALKEQGISLVALRCAGFNNVDLEAAKTHGITVCRVPDYSPFAVAEHAVALILDLNRNIHRAYNRVRENDYSLKGLMGFDLYGKKVGVIGAGKIGKAFINIMQGFGCEVLVADPFVKQAELPNGCSLVSNSALFEQCNIVSLHCPLTPETHHLINEQTIQNMQPGVMLINTSRGALVDTAAVIKALKSRHIGYLGIDVYEEEADLFFEDLSNTFIEDDIFARLQTFPNVVITGHQAFFTKEAMQRIAEVTLDNINNYSLGKIDDMYCV